MFTTMTPQPKQWLIFVAIAVWTVTSVRARLNTAAEPFHFPIGGRFPPTRPFHSSTNETCQAGALCACPGRMYPLGHQEGLLLESIFVVPDLPQEFDPVETTYYDYFNVFWRDNPVGGYMNQFVPQLMLGNALANSTNHPHYNPHWIQLKKWHIGAQYFMGLCVKNDTFPDGFECDEATWIGKAATGRLVQVEPGEVIYTSFHLTNNRKWILRIGVVGGPPDRQSQVVVTKPFMGLVKSTKRWDENTYKDIYVGSCLENYGMKSSKNYPPEWNIAINTFAPRSGEFWSDWSMDQRRKCPWQPASTVSSDSGPSWQRATWNASLDKSQIVSEVS